MTFPRAKTSLCAISRTVLEQLSAGRSTDDIVRELHGNGWELEEAREFVAKLHEHRDTFAQRLELRDPDLRPMRRQPVLFTINGIGAGLYGARDRDPATGTYVKTHCICLVFVPVLALGAYRVAPAERGWIMIGKTRLSRLAKGWNILVLCTILGLVGLGFWESHKSNPDYQAGQAIARGDEAVRQGDLLTASQEYRKAAGRLSAHSQAARDKLAELSQQAVLSSLPIDTTSRIFAEIISLGGWRERAASIFDSGAALVRQHAVDAPVESAELWAVIAPNSEPMSRELALELLDGPFRHLPAEQLRAVYQLFLESNRRPEFHEAVVEKGLRWLEEEANTDSYQALAFARFLSTYAPGKAAELATARRRLLESAVAAYPDDVDLRVQLAQVCEQTGDVERVKTLLMPLREKLGDGEGARLLGQIFAAEGAFDDAYALLEPYLASRLAELHAAEEGFRQAINDGQQRLIQGLENGTAVEFDYPRYRTLGEDRQQTMVIDYIEKQLKSDVRVTQARNRLVQTAVVVPVAIDLGMVTLRRAQGMTDPDARRAELEKAEKTFLAVQGVAGDDDGWKLQVGQVYYWLGKPEEGKREFDQVLANNDRSCELLVDVAQVLREIGDYGEARKCLEEAYDKATDDQTRYAAAQLRTSSRSGLQDEITWLERCDPSTPSVQAQLSNVRGDQAREVGKRDEAAEHYRETIQIYEGMNETASSLNNCALSYFSLFGVTGDKKRVVQGNRIGRASDCPGSRKRDSARQCLLRAGEFRDQRSGGPAAGGLPHEKLGGLWRARILAEKRAGTWSTSRAGANHPDLKRALSYLDKTMVLAPRGVSAYTTAATIGFFLHDVELLGRLAARLDTTSLDTAAMSERYVTYYRFEEDADETARRAQEITLAEQLLAEYVGADNRLAFAAAVGDLVEKRLTMHDAAAIDSERLVQLAEQAHAEAPSAGTYSTLISALLYRASLNLAATFPEYAQAAEAARRSLSTDSVVVLVLAREDELGRAAPESPEVQRAVELVVARNEQFPSARGPWSWALLQAMAADRAEALRTHIAEDQAGRLERMVSLQIAPFNAAAALLEYWARMATGQADTARAPLEQAIELGAPVPSYLLGWQTN